MQGAEQIMLEINNVSFRYRRKMVLRDINFKVGKGECLVLAGANGAGKSTLLSIIAGILKPGSGEVFCHGKIGYLPQGISLFEDMSVKDNLLFFAGLAKCSVPESLPFSLEEKRHEKVGRLSGGQKKQLSIACALLGNPEILLLDEPIASLDFAFRDEFLEMLRELKEQGMTIVYVGHDPVEFENICDSILFLGSKNEYFTREEFLEKGSDNSLFVKNYINMIKRKM